MTHSAGLDALWEDFHHVVNMTSRELDAWLRTRDAGERTEPLPDQAGPPLGQQVLAVLRKRRTDLTDEDVRVMTKVVEMVSGQTDLANEPEPARTSRRHALMSIGHDPLKP
ncbi:DUF3140 domain-containing protein [Streptomyces sp. NPDC052687]|uniref:DUF3140 domain-containing protein n=1 Tax=Streptomyces sp. NPDC052687 TaxID=3154759 RepID=UPI00342767D8